MLDLTNMSDTGYRLVRERTNSGIVAVGQRVVEVGGRSYTATIYSVGIAEDAHLGRIPETRGHRTHNNNG